MMTGTVVELTGNSHVWYFGDLGKMKMETNKSWWSIGFRTEMTKTKDHAGRMSQAGCTRVKQ